MSDKLMVLVVDDDRCISEGASLRLRAAGFDTAIANNGHTRFGTTFDGGDMNRAACELDEGLVLPNGTILGKLLAAWQTDVSESGSFPR